MLVIHPVARVAQGVLSFVSDPLVGYALCITPSLAARRVAGLL